MSTRIGYIGYKILDRIDKDVNRETGFKAVQDFRDTRPDGDYHRHISYLEEVYRLDNMFEILAMEVSYENFVNVKKQISGLKFYIKYRERIGKTKKEVQKRRNLEELKRSIAR